MIVAILGDRAGVDLWRVEGWLRRLAAKHPDAIVVTTLDPHVCRRVDQAAPGAGLRTARLDPESRVRWAEHPRPIAPWRPVDWDNLTEEEEESFDRWRRLEREYDETLRSLLSEFVVALYETTPGDRTRARALDAVFDSFADAEAARDRMIAELADRVVVFVHGQNGSGPATSVIEEFHRLGKPEDRVLRIRA